MYSMILFNRLLNSEFPGKFVHKFSSIDFYKSTRVLPLGENHIVIYGSDNCDEGNSDLFIPEVPKLCAAASLQVRREA